MDIFIGLVSVAEPLLPVKEVDVDWLSGNSKGGRIALAGPTVCTYIV